jgi:hypothetical protein
MSGYQPPSRPERPRKEKPEEESRLVSFREWLSTTAGITSAICAIITLIGGTLVAVKILDKNPPAITPAPIRMSQNQASPSPVIHNSAGSLSTSHLQSALLPSQTVGSTAIVQSTGTDLSQIGVICGGPLSGDAATAYEKISDQQDGTALDEVLTSWDSTSDARQAIADARRTIDQRESCSITTSNGSTLEYTGDDPGSPPSSCVNPGQYLATQAKISSPSVIFPYFGFAVIAQCGPTTIFIRVYSRQPGAITQQVADGYLGSAVGRLRSTTS